jgi:hypothetical protein
MKGAAQLDKRSLKYIRVSQKERKYLKFLHKKALRRQSKNPSLPNPQHNRFVGWI